MKIAFSPEKLLWKRNNPNMIKYKSFNAKKIESKQNSTNTITYSTYCDLNFSFLGNFFHRNLNFSFDNSKIHLCFEKQKTRKRNCEEAKTKQTHISTLIKPNVTPFPETNLKEQNYLTRYIKTNFICQKEPFSLTRIEKWEC